MNRQVGWVVLPSLLLGSSLYSFSGKITPGEAKSIATEFVRSRTGNHSGKVDFNQAALAGSESNPLYYVFNIADNGGFVMISAESAAYPVIGYSFEGAFPTENIPGAMKWMLEGIEKEINAAPGLQASLSHQEALKAARAAGQNDVYHQKLLETPKWSQEGVFNQKIPGQPLVGCVGTAMATIMKYHNWPEKGVGELGGVSFATAYDWSNMRMDNYRYGSTQQERDAVATLMYHASKSIDTQYSMSGSSAYEARVPAALSTYFGYDPAASFKKRSEVSSQAEWERIVMDEIDADRPVLYCGQDVTVGHAFVCDGYEKRGDTTYLHFNWGWGGVADGYYISTVLNPVVSRAHDYSNLNTIIYNIKKADGVIAKWSPIHITSQDNQPGIGSDLIDLTNGKSFTVRVGFLTNSTFTTFNGKLAVALTDEKGKVKALLSDSLDCTFQGMESILESVGRVTTFNKCALPAGTSVTASDVIRIVSQADGSNEWLPLPGELYTASTLSPKPGTPASFKINLPANVAGVNVEGNGSVIKGFDYSFKVTPENPAEDVITVKANGNIITSSDDNTYHLNNVCADQEITILVQKAADVIAKRSVWVGTPGTLSSIISESDASNVKNLTLYGSIDARDFEYMRTAMNLERLDMTGVSISAYGSDMANAMPREALRGERALKEVTLPKSVNRFNNGCFRETGLTAITIPNAVSKYEYNVFVGCNALRDIWVERDHAEFINWCVLSGVRTDLLTLHVRNQAAKNNYSKAENWKDIKNIEISEFPAESGDVRLALMENNEVNVNILNDVKTGEVAKGTVVTFKASHIADNDNKMEVYANTTRLYPDAEGNYTATITGNTIIHCDLIPPQRPAEGTLGWKLSGRNGSIGLFTDAVNVIPGKEFTVRLNALEVPQYFENLYWALVLTDKESNIKEFISPVNTWQGGVANNHKYSVTCKVNESDVREGNMIRLVNSANKRDWFIVKGVSEDIVDAIPAVNNQSQIYNMRLHGIVDSEGNVAEIENASVSGVESTALRGQDMTLSIVPTSSAYKVDLKVNGEQVATRAASVEYPFVAMQDMDFEVNVYNPAIGTTKVIDTYPGGLHIQLGENNVAETLVIRGTCRSQDLLDGLNKDWAVKTVKVLDLSELEIVADGSRHLANELKHTLFKSPTGTPAVVEKIILPNSILRIWKEGSEGPFDNCKNIEELTLPEGIKSIPFTTGSSTVLRYALGTNVLAGCDNLKVIRIVGEPQTYQGKQCVAYFDPAGYKWGAQYYGLGVNDPKKITVIVPEEHLALFQKPDNDQYTGNPWLLYGYNMLSYTPVFGVEFDPSRVRMADETVNAAGIASFLGDNVSKETISTEGKLFPANPDANATVYVDGEKVELAADGSIPVIFHNPKFNAELAGNHKIDVEYTLDLNFHAISKAFAISEPEVTDLEDATTSFILLSDLEDEEIGNESENGKENNNEEETSKGTHKWDTTEALKPVLRNVKENSKIRFKVDCSIDESKGVLPKVMVDNVELAADAEGYYELNLVGSNKIVEIFAVPTEGAVINAEDLASIKPEEAAGISSISIEGEMSKEQLAEVVKDFSNLENLDLSSFKSELPANAFSGMSSLTNVVLPEVTEIPAGTFNDCKSLQSVDVPASVNAIGAGAFEGCAALEKLTLTGVSEIGANAFNGCENLTVITLLSDNSATSSETPVQLRGKRAASVASSFAGVNPNCIIVLDEGVAIPESDANYIKAAEAEIEETLADGTVLNRKGRVYSATRDITIVPGHPLAIPHTFTIKDGAKVKMDVEANGWTPIVAPFDVQNITDASDKEVEFKVLAADELLTGNVIYTLVDDTDNLKGVTGVKANTPVFLRLEENSKITLEATDTEIPATPAEIKAEGKDFSIHAVYTTRGVSSENTYVLSDDGMAFIPVEAEDENGNKLEEVTLSPFRIYATSSVELSEILTSLPLTAEEKEATGVEEVGDNKFSIAKENGMLVIYAPEAMTTALYTADGKLLGYMKLEVGRNVFALPGSGIYVIGNRKFIF